MVMIVQGVEKKPVGVISVTQLTVTSVDDPAEGTGSTEITP
jgi:hypothetical protein